MLPSMVAYLIYRLMLRYSFGVGVPNLRPQLLNYGDPTVKTSEIGFFSRLALSNLNEMLKFKI